MRPAFSVVFLTTLIGAGQGLFIALFTVHLGASAHGVTGLVTRFLTAGAAFSFILCALGLVASFFHLGRPERAWRTAAMWRTSWLSREVIALPAFMVLVALYGFAHSRGWPREQTLVIGWVTLAACVALFWCTSMIYACIKFLQEWASRFTTVNFMLIGMASGFLLATVLASLTAQRGYVVYRIAVIALVLTVGALLVRVLSLVRNHRIRHKSTLQSATGMRGKVRQISQGFTGQSFNTQEFFHGVPPAGMTAIRIGFILLAFVIPAILLVAAMTTRSGTPLLAACAMQYAGLVLERWYFLADSRHPQNLYYQNVA